MAQEKRRISIRTRTAVALGIVAIALPVGGAFAVASATRDAMRERALDGQVATAQAIASQSERSIDFAVDLVKQAARRPGLSAWVASGDPAGQESVLENLARIDLYRSLGTFTPEQRLSAAHPREPEIDTGGDWGVESFVSEPERREADSVIVVREPVIVDGEIVGFVVGEVSLDRTVFGFSSLRFGKTGALTLVAADGEVLLSGDPARRGTELMAPTLRELAASDGEATGEYHSVLLERGEVAAFVPVEGTEWGVLATRASSEVFADVENLERALVLGALVIVLLGSGITVLMWRNATTYERQIDADQQALETAARELERTAMETEAANQSLREFVAVAAHDLRGPLSSVAGFAELLILHSDHLDEGRYLAYADTILQQSDVMSAIVEDLQTISQLESGHVEAAREAVSAREAITRVTASFGDAAVGVTIECPDGVQVLADPRHVDRILRNYVSNAFKYGEPPVAVKVEVKGGFVDTRVCDEGAGVPEEFVPRLFQKFARAEATRTARPGTGLGLSIVRGLARLNGGDAWYEPATPRGSRFVVRLPEPTEPGVSSPGPVRDVPVPAPA